MGSDDFVGPNDGVPIVNAKHPLAPGVLISVQWLPPCLISLRLGGALQSAAKPALRQAWLFGLLQTVVTLAPGNTGRIKLLEIPWAGEVPLPIIGDVTGRRRLS